MQPTTASTEPRGESGGSKTRFSTARAKFALKADALGNLKGLSTLVFYIFGRKSRKTAQTFEVAFQAGLAVLTLLEHVAQTVANH